MTPLSRTDSLNSLASPRASTHHDPLSGPVSFDPVSANALFDVEAFLNQGTASPAAAASSAFNNSQVTHLSATSATATRTATRDPMTAMYSVEKLRLGMNLTQFQSHFPDFVAKFRGRLHFVSEPGTGRRISAMTVANGFTTHREFEQLLNKRIVDLNKKIQELTKELGASSSLAEGAFHFPLDLMTRDQKEQLARSLSSSGKVDIMEGLSLHGDIHRTSTAKIEKLTADLKQLKNKGFKIPPQRTKTGIPRGVAIGECGFEVTEQQINDHSFLDIKTGQRVLPLKFVMDHHKNLHARNQNTIDDLKGRNDVLFRHFMKTTNGTSPSTGMSFPAGLNLSSNSSSSGYPDPLSSSLLGRASQYPPGMQPMGQMPFNPGGPGHFTGPMTYIPGRPGHPMSQMPSNSGGPAHFYFQGAEVFPRPSQFASPNRFRQVVDLSGSSSSSSGGSAARPTPVMATRDLDPRGGGETSLNGVAPPHKRKKPSDE